ncbi:DUF1338 family protein [Corynebacterium poyangense]|uniref:2-oxoadipate dioxygenase/decarboxylase n=1 Tax=Corynebacterium poyangense TaxID=2684405 RepID=A0A7H0SQM7_9CORY|nr:VOC family protein [Corynebacterium poyangense]QNQ90852.1 DUF1338 family protein [Corynebacterium poyangense]
MTSTQRLARWELRAAFAQRLSQMYGEEVPAYTTLVEVSEAVNRDYQQTHPELAEHLGSISRVTAERHGAIRVGTPQELTDVARVFAAFGMYPVGFYDLRDAAASSVPVVSTAFRPIDAEELARNPFRVFTSMLTVDDPRFFSPDLQQRLEAFLAQRTLFPEELLLLADKADREDGLGEPEASRLLELATASFKLSDDPVDESWYRELEQISAVAADIGGVTTTHINHLTPRVLDIDDLYARMEQRGITMIDEVQGPPGWDGPDILLRQTSFRALDEQRVFRFPDGSTGPGTLRVRFGEVEQRGIALTPAGRDIYDRMVAETDQLLHEEPGAPRAEIARRVWQKHIPTTEKELDEQGLGYFTYELAASPEDIRHQLSGGPEGVELQELIDRGLLRATPIVYEDFLPRSAAGIFQSNLTGEGTRDNSHEAARYDAAALSTMIGRELAEPTELYAAQRAQSLADCAEALGQPIIDYPSHLKG